MFWGHETGLYGLQRPLLSADAAFKQWVGAGTTLAGYKTGSYRCPLVFESASGPSKALSLADSSPRHKTPFSVCSDNFSRIFVQSFPQSCGSPYAPFLFLSSFFPASPHLHLEWPPSPLCDWQSLITQGVSDLCRHLEKNPSTTSLGKGYFLF